MKGLGISGQFSRCSLHISVDKFARNTCLNRQSPQGSSWSDSMLPLFEQNNLYLSRPIDAACVWAETMHLKHLKEIVWEFLQHTGEEFVLGGLTLPLAKRYTKSAEACKCKRGVGLFDNILALSGESLLSVSSQANALSRFRDICGTVI